MKIRATQLLAIGLVIVGISLIVVSNQKTIQIIIDDDVVQHTTFASTVKGVLDDANIELNPADQISPSNETKLIDGDVIQINRAIQVRIWEDSDLHVFMSPERIPANLIQLAKIDLYPGDEVLVDGQLIDPSEPLELAPILEIQVIRAVEVTLVDDQQIIVFNSTAPTLGQALSDVDIILQSGDRLSPSPETALNTTMQALLERAQPYSITVEDQQYDVYSAASSVGEVLAEVGLPLQGMDYSIPGEEESVPDDGIIEVVRVHETVIFEQQPLVFQTLYQPLADVDIDEQRVVQVGQYGLTTNRVRIRYENGVEVSRQVEDEWTAREPTPRIIGYGTRITVRTVNTADGPIEYWRAITAYATSYSPSRAGTPLDSPWYGITYSGVPLSKGLVAVLRSWYPSMGGSQIYVQGYGFGTVADIGGGIAGRHWIDLGYSDDDFINWHDWVTVYFLTPVPPADQILWILP